MANTYTGSDVGKAGLNVAEEDGSPSVFGVTKINVTDGTLTDNGGGEVTITTGGGGGGTPGGSDGQVQYNNGGSFGGASALAYDDTNNRVGINTTSPEAKLEVVATTASEYGMVVDHANGQFAITQYGGIHLDNAESTPNLWQISERDGESLDFAFGTPDSGKNVAASSTALRITSDGEVGIGLGSTDPACELEVRAVDDSGEVDFRVSRDSTQWIGFRNSDASGGYLLNHSRESNKKPLYIDSVHNSAGSAAGDLNILFRTGAESAPTERMRILESNGNVGIGVTSPAQKLHVSGTIRQTASTSSVLVSNANGDIISSSNVQDVAYLETVGVYFPSLTTPQPALPNSSAPTALTPSGYIQVDVGGTQYLLPAYIQS